MYFFTEEEIFTICYVLKKRKNAINIFTLFIAQGK